MIYTVEDYFMLTLQSSTAHSVKTIKLLLNAFIWLLIKLRTNFIWLKQEQIIACEHIVVCEHIVACEHIHSSLWTYSSLWTHNSLWTHSSLWTYSSLCNLIDYYIYLSNVLNGCILIFYIKFRRQIIEIKIDNSNSQQNM